jgi:hypothetical protein
VTQLYPRHWVPILVVFYHTHELRWDYYYPPFTTLRIAGLTAVGRSVSYMPPFLNHCIHTVNNKSPSKEFKLRCAVELTKTQVGVRSKQAVRTVIVSLSET